MDDARQDIVAKNVGCPDATANSLLTARGLGVRGPSGWLIEGVDISVRKGEIVTLIGPNGSGKSTTVRALLGLIDADAGVIERAPKLSIGYVPQKLSIDWTLPLTVRRFMNLSARHSNHAVDAALDEVGIAEHAAAEVQGLSGGEFQRLLLARAMVGAPDLLVLDEPVQGVDPSGQIALYELIASLRQRHGCAILMISHDLHIVMAETDTVICLNGHVCCSGTPQSVSESPEYRMLFGPRAAEALAVYHHHHDHRHLPDGRVVATDGSDAHAACTHPDHEKGHEHG